MKSHCPRSLPLFFDLVGDKTRSRVLTVLVVLFVLNMVLYVVMSAVLRDPGRSYGASFATTLHMFYSPLDVPPIGSSYAQQPMFLVRGNGDLAVSSVNVTGVVMVARASFHSDWTLLCYQVYEAPRDLRNELANVICPEFLSPENATVDVNELGVARYHNFGASYGFSASLVSRFISQPHAYSKPVFHAVSSAINPDTVSIVHDISGASLLVGIPLGTVRVHLGGIVGRKVFLMCLDVEQVSWDSITTDSPRYCDIEPSSAISDSVGVATFSNVTIRSANHRLVNVYVLFESGVAPLMVQGRSTLSLQSRVGKVEIPSDDGAFKNYTAAEQVPLRADQVPRIVVLDEFGNPLAGKTVFAVISEIPSSSPCPFFASDVLERFGQPAKGILASLSLPTDQNGVAKWDSLTFSAQGPAGRYGVKFVCDGVVSSEVVYFRVESSVSRVLLVVDAPIEQVDRVAIVELPMLMQFVVAVVVLDQNNQTIVGKTVDAMKFGSPATAAVWFPQYDIGIITMVVVRGTNHSFEQFLRSRDPADLDSWTLSVDGVASQTMYIAPQVSESAEAFPMTGVDLLEVPACLVVGQPSHVKVRAFTSRNEAAVNVKLSMTLFENFPGALLDSTPTLTDSNGIATIPVVARDGFNTRILCQVNIVDSFYHPFPTPIIVTIVNNGEIACENATATSTGVRLVFRVSGVADLSNCSLRLVSQPEYPSNGGVANALWSRSDPAAAALGSVVAWDVTLSVSGNYTFYAQVGSLGALKSDLVTWEWDGVPALATLDLVQQADGMQGIGVPYTQQPVVRISSSASLPLSGLRLMAYACNNSDAYVVGSAATIVSPSSSLDDSQFFLSAPSDEQGEAHFVGLAPFFQKELSTGYLCFSLAIIDAVPTAGHVALPQSPWRLRLGMHGQLVLNKVLTVTQIAPSIEAALMIQCSAPATTPQELVAGDVLLLENVVCSGSPVIAAHVHLVDATTGAAANVQLNSTFVFFRTSSTFPPLRVSGGLPGIYNVSLSLHPEEGMSAMVVGQFKLTVQANSLSFLVDAPTLVNRNYGNGRPLRIGTDVLTVVLIASHYGRTPVNGVLIKGTLDKGSLGDEQSYVQSTPTFDIPFFSSGSDGGYAMFDLRFTDANILPGVHRLTFTIAGTDISVTSSPFQLVRIVCIDVVRAPKGNSFRLGSEGEALITDDAALGIASLIQPILFLSDCAGHGISGLQVTPLLNDGEAGTLLQYDTSAFSNENGIYEFSDLRILAGQTQLYNMTFVAVGATSNFTVLRVYDTLDPDISSLSDVELIIGLTLLAAIPLLLFNSSWVDSSVLVIGGFVLGVLLTIGAIVFLSLTLTIPGIIAVSSHDPFLIANISLAFLLATLPILYSLLLAYRMLRGLPGTDQLAERMSLYVAHVRCLFAPVEQKHVDKAAARLAVAELQAQRLTRMKEAAANERASAMMRIVLKFRAEFYDIWIKFKADYVYDVAHVDYHKPFQGKRAGFQYSQRFLLAVGVSALFLAYSIMFGFIASLLVSIAFRKAKIALSIVQAGLLERSQRLLSSADGAAFQQAASMLSQSALVQAAGVEGLLLEAFEFFGNQTNVVSTTEWAIWLGDSTLAALAQRITYTGMASSCVGAFVGAAIIGSMFRSYRAQILDARCGRLPDSFDRHGVRPTAASELPGVVAAHTVTGFLVMFLAIWVLSFLFSFELVRTASWSLVKPYFLTLLSINLFWFVLHFIFSVVIRDGYDIRSRWVFSLFDFVETFLACVTSILYAVLRMIIGLLATILLFMNPAVPLMGWSPLILFDFSFKAWRALIMNDAYFHSPIVNVFVATLWERHRKRESKSALDQDDEDTRMRRNVRNLFWHAIVLARFPALQKKFGGRATEILSKSWDKKPNIDDYSSHTDTEEDLARITESTRLIRVVDNDNNE